LPQIPLGELTMSQTLHLDLKGLTFKAREGKGRIKRKGKGRKR